MANANFKSEYGLLVVNDSTLSGNVSVANASYLFANNVLPVSNAGTLGSTTARWNLTSNTVAVSNTLTVTGNVVVNTNALVVLANTTTNRVGVGTGAPDATFAVTGTANVSGNVYVGGLTTIASNTTIGSNVLFVSAAAGSERVGIKNGAPSATHALAIGGNTFVDGILTIRTGQGYYLETDQLKVNSAIQLGSNVLFTFAGSIVGDILPAYKTGTFVTTTTLSNTTIVVTTGNTDPLAIGFSIVGSNIPVGAVVSSVINSTAFIVSSAPTSTLTNNTLTYYSKQVSNTLTSFALGSSTDANTRWDVYAKTVTIDKDTSIAGKLTLSNTTATHVISGNVNIDSGVLFIDSVNNRVGINNTAPNASLAITGTANVSGNVVIGGTTTIGGNTSVTGALHTITGNVNIDSGALFVDSVNNRVGINNTTPDASLTITGTANVSGNVNFSNTVFIGGNTRIGNTTSYVLAKTDGSLRLTDEIEIGNTSVYSNTSTVATAATVTNVDTFFTNQYGCSKYIITYNSTSNNAVYGATEALVVHNGTDVIITEYASVFSTDIGFTLSANVVTTNCNLYATAAQGNLQITITRISMV